MMADRRNTSTVRKKIIDYKPVFASKAYTEANWKYETGNVIQN